MTPARVGLDPALLRDAVGASAALWAGEDGVRVEADRWLAFSGASAADYNVALCHGPGSVAATRDEILAAGRPALLSVTARALAEVQELVAAGWVCVGAVPLLARPIADLAPAAPDPDGLEIRQLVPAEHAAARELIADVFRLDRDLAAVALPDAGLAAPGREIWGAIDAAGRILSCVVSVIVGEVVCIWSTATAASARRQGHGGRLLSAAMAGAEAAGARVAAFQSDPDAESFYAGLGFVELERWQVWSRPRWVLGRA